MVAEREKENEKTGNYHHIISCSRMRKHLGARYQLHCIRYITEFNQFGDGAWKDLIKIGYHSPRAKHGRWIPTTKR